MKIQTFHPTIFYFYGEGEGQKVQNLALLFDSGHISYPRFVTEQRI